MRRRMIIEDKDIEPQSTLDEQQQMLNDTLVLLKPIRDHRYLKSQRQWRKEKQALRQIEQVYQQKQQQLANQEQQQIDMRNKLDNQHKNKPITQLTLQEWMAAERDLIIEIQTTQQALQTLQLNLTEQQQRVEHAQQAMTLQQKEVTKLDEMQRWIKE